MNRPALSLSARPSRSGVAAALRRPLLPALLALLVVALLSGGVWAATGKSASVAVDGQAREVAFRGDTVADVLDAAGLEVGEHDQVVPAVTSPIKDGDRVALRRGRLVSLVVDGEAREVWVTAASVDEALDQVGLQQEGLALSASRSREIPLEGLRLEVTTPKRIAVIADGATRELDTTAPTVAEALAWAAVPVGSADRLSYPATQPIAAGLIVQVTRIAIERDEQEVAVPFGTERRDDPELLVGVTKQVTAGRSGTQVRTVERVFADGVLEATNVVGTRPGTEPVTRVVAVGTKPKPAAAPRAAAAPRPAAAPRAASAPSASSGQDEGARGSTGSAGLNWPALARCESGGNPSAVSSTGKYRGLYQFSTQTWAGVGGSGDPAAASSGEQTYRAQVLFDRSGAGQWPSCGRNLFR